MARAISNGISSDVDCKPSRELIVATQTDVLFKPLIQSGKKVLSFRRGRLERGIREWAEVRGVGPEVSEADDVKYLRSLDPVNWKDQDHYAVMGLQHLRFRATDEDIKRYYRLRVLRHHPDKRQAAGEVVNPESDYFACIVKAYEILGNLQKRRSYDSVDPKFDDYIPPKTVSSESEFFKIYGDWFALNSRWSTQEPVPLLGNMLTPREKIEEFYSFWYDFDSWREYSYLDEEDKEKGQYREERRWIEKQNKQARAKLKKEEMARIRSVVDNAYACDPRIALIKEQDSQKKLAKKQARQNAARQKLEEEQRAREEAETKARLERERVEAEEREKELASKKEKEAFKKALKKERKNLRTICKSQNYYCNADEDVVTSMATVEQLCESLQLSDLEELCKRLNELSFEESRNLFLKKGDELQAKIESEKKQTVSSVTARNGPNSNSDGEAEWSLEELSLLTKAVNLFPAGTNKRWEVVASFLHQHSGNEGKKQRTAKEVLAKAKDLKTADFSKNVMKEEANAKAFDIFEKSVKNVPVESEATKAEEQAALCNGKTGSKNGVSDTVRTWSPEEQKLLEQALKTYPSTVADRWDRIADCVPSRSKKECMARFKEIAALVKAKKSAQTLVNK